MEPERLRELATNAQLDHWPPHLGVKTDAEKIEYLAQRLREAAQALVDQDALIDEKEAAETDAESLRDGIKDLNEQIDELVNSARELKAQLHQ